MVQPLPVGGCVTHIIYPHSLFAYLAEHYVQEFELYLAAAPSRLAEFWKGFLRTRYGARLRATHPTLSKLNIEELARCVPLTLHGDAAPYTKKRSALFVQWASLLGRQTKI